MKNLFGLFTAILKLLNNGIFSSAQEPTANGTTLSLAPQNTGNLLRIKRNPSLTTADGVFGVMVCSNGWSCFTLENRGLVIPAGLYGIEIYDSPHAGHPVPRLQNVPGRSEIEIHCGNVPEDSKGCILVGLDRIEGTIERSQDAFSILFPLISSAISKGAVVQLEIS
jgi:hypothetical protein